MFRSTDHGLGQSPPKGRSRREKLRSAAHAARGAIIGLLLLLGAIAPSLPAQQEDEVLDQFLARLGLAELRITHLEQMLDAPVATERKEPLARRLADLYAERLMRSSDDRPRYEDTVQRITRLLGRFPQANTTALQVILLQADYNRAETLVARWISQPDETGPRDEARQILVRITPELVAHRNELNPKVNQLVDEIDALDEGDALQTKEAELRSLQGIAARANYFAGWSNYYLGLVTQAAPGAQPFTSARDIFLQLLGFESSVPDDLEPEWLGLESIWRARSVIGLGLSLAACGDLETASRCFEALNHSSAPEEVRDQAPYWFVRALLAVGERARAEQYARQQITQYHPPASQGQVSLCVALVREGFGTPPVDPPLGNLGLVGLARLGQLGAIQAMIDKYQIQAAARSGFVLLWATGQQQFAAAEKSKAAADYQAAVKTLLRALQAPETRSLAGPAARCRYTLGWCYFRLEQLAEAAREFSNAFPGLRESGDQLAVESAWMAFVALRQLATSRPEYVPRVTEAQKRLQQHFPKHAYTQRAAYEMTKLMENVDPEKMVQQLESLAPEDENYALARYDLCLLQHRLWTKQRSDPQQSAARTAALRSAVDTYLAAVPGDTDAQRKLKVCLLAADAALHSTPPSLETAAGVLRQAAPWASQLPDQQAQVAEYHYRLLEWAVAKNDAAQRQQEAEWLTARAAGSAYEKAALVIAANAVDRQVRAATTADREGLEQQAYTTYRRLAGLLGTSAAALKASKNAEACASRLAHYALRTGRAAEAAAALDALLKVRPRDRRYLQRAADAHTQAGQVAQALPYLRTLLTGLTSGSEPWYAAKYAQLSALSRTDPQQARKVFQQFRLLHPDLGGSAWRDKFTELTRNW